MIGAVASILCGVLLASQSAPARSKAEPTKAVQSELPTLDDDLLDLLEAPDATDATASAFSFQPIAQARLRLELERAKNLRPGPIAPGLALTGRLGAEFAVGAHSARIVLVEGRRLSHAEPGDLVPPRPRVQPELGLLDEAQLSLAFPLFGLPATVALGRAHITLADGRWMGTARFEPRGVSVDGATFQTRWDRFDAQLRAGTYYLAPISPSDEAALSWMSFLEGSGHTKYLQAFLYGFVFRDGFSSRLGFEPVTAPTLGTRLGGEAGPFHFHLGADMQVALDDATLLAPAGWGAHLEATGRFSPALSAFKKTGTVYFGLDTEATFGSPTQGLTFHSPSPKGHNALDRTDLLGTDNVLMAALVLGTKAAELLEMEAAVRTFALADPTGSVHNYDGIETITADFSRQNRYLMTSVDAHVRLLVADNASVQAEYAIAFPGASFAGATPIQRLFLQVAFHLQ